MPGTRRRIIRKLLTQPPRQTARKAVARTVSAVKAHRRYRLDMRHPTGSAGARQGKLRRYFTAETLRGAGPALREARPPDDVIEHYLQHRFNLLGSGWVRVRHGMHCRGLAGHRYDMDTAVEADRDGNWLRRRVNAANLERSQAIWRLIEGDYLPIDWQLDFKSGHRWSEATWYGHIPLDPGPGVDIKVPWELARCQHLPQLALAYVALGDERDAAALRRRVAQEFRNQVLDFLATNPVRFGVNWRCAMDVGIRVANWLVAYDLFRAAGREWDGAFEEVFAAAVEDHAGHLAGNLEWNAKWRSNHYLADIAGLLFATAYLPCSATTDARLAFSILELVRETGEQFTKDGANFEGSTSYHRLSAEVVIWCTGLVLALDEDKRRALQEYDHRLFVHDPGLAAAPLPMYAIPGGEGSSPFPHWYWRRLQRMGDFTRDVTKPNGRIHQVGDNDSGRFLNLQPAWQAMSTAEAKQGYGNLADYEELPGESTFRQEDYLIHRSLTAQVEGLFSKPDAQAGHSEKIDAVFIRGLVGKGVSPMDGRRAALRVEPLHPCRSLVSVTNRIASKRGISRVDFRIDLPGIDPAAEAVCLAYEDFGLYIWRNGRFYLAVRCGPVGRKGHRGHEHHDQLAIELCIGGRDRIADPGTGVYQPDRAMRNAFRSVAAHFAPQIADGREPGRLDQGVFELDGDPRAECLYFGREGFAGMHRGYGPPVYRVFRLEPGAILVSDFAAVGLELRPQADLGPDCAWSPPVPFSPGYGIWKRAGSRIADGRVRHLNPIEYSPLRNRRESL